MEEAEVTLAENNKQFASEKRRLSLYIENQSEQIETLNRLLQEKMSSSSDIDQLQKDNDRLRNELESKEKSFSEHKEKAKKIVKTQQVKLKSLQEEVQNLKAQKIPDNTNNDDENEALRSLLDEKNEIIRQLNERLHEEQNQHLAEELRTAQGEAKGTRANSQVYFPLLIFALNHQDFFSTTVSLAFLKLKTVLKK